MRLCNKHLLSFLYSHKGHSIYHELDISIFADIQNCFESETKLQAIIKSHLKRMFVLETIILQNENEGFKKTSIIK